MSVATSAETFERLLFEPLERLDGPAILGPGGADWPDLLRRADAVAARLRAEGLREDMRVGIDLDPTPAYVVTLLAVLRSGAKALLLSPSWTAPEVDRCLELVQPSFLITHGPVPGSRPPRATFGMPEPETTLLDLRGNEHEPSLPGDAVVIFTSGTSGTPKGVVLTAEGLLANVAAIREYLGVESADRSPLFTPTCYAYAVSQVLVQMLGRAPICPIRNGLKYPVLILEAIAEHRIRGLSANPTSFKILLKTAAETDLDLRSLRYAMGGGQFLARDVVDAMEARFGCRVVNQYGCTENSPRICFHWVRDGELPMPGRSLPVGKGVRGTELRVAAEGATPVADGGTGQVLVRGTSLMSRYWRMPRETADRFADGWLKTGDVGMLDPEGNLVLIGRLSDVINVGNEKVNPGEVEGYLQEMPQVQEAALFGTGDALLGEAVEAIVVPRDGASLDDAGATRMARLHLKKLVSAHKIPRRVHVRRSLPRNLYGKLDRKRLAEWAADADR